MVGLLGCGVMAGLGAGVNTGNVSRGDSVAVIGCGGVGDSAIAGARLAGASPIIAIDRDPKKLQWATELGATHTIDASEADAVEAVQELTGGSARRRRRRGGPSGNVEAGLVRSRSGRHCRVGRRAHFGVDTRDAAHRLLLPRRRVEVVVVRRRLPERDFPALVELYQQGRLPLEKFVSERIKLDQVEEAFATMHRGEVLRSVVVL